MDPATPAGSQDPTFSTADASTGELLSRLSQETSRLVRDEIRLAQAELADTGKRAGMGVGLFSAGGIVALYGVGALLAAIIAALALAMPVWLAALIVALVLFIVAGVAAVVAKKQMRQVSPTPERTVQTVKADVDAVKEARHRDHRS